MNRIPENTPESPLHPVVALTTELVGRASITPADSGCQQVIATRLAEAGFACESMVFGDVTNLWARKGNRSPLLCLAGHTDVVPPGNLAEWNTDPFEPVTRDGLLFGRGAADMKGSLAAMVVAAERFVAAHPDFDGSLAFLITSDEEGPAFDGTRKVVETLSARGEQIDWCIVGEPSSQTELGDCMRIGRRGSLTGSLKVRGVQGHVAYPHLASNPIRSFAPVLAELHACEWDQGNANFPPTSFQVVHLESGAGADNVIPFELNIRFNFRYSTEWDSSSLQKKVEAMFDKHNIDYELEWILQGDPFLTAEGQLSATVAQAVKEIVDVEPELSTGGGTSDGRFIAPTGADVIELGPCNASIHKVNEHVSIADLVRLSEVYERSMEKLMLR